MEKIIVIGKESRTNFHFVLLHLETLFDVGLEFSPEIKSILFQSRSPLQPLLQYTLYNWNGILIMPKIVPKFITEDEKFYLHQLKESGFLLWTQQRLALLSVEAISVVSSVIGDSQMIRHTNLSLQKTELKALEPRGWGQILPTTHKQHLKPVRFVNKSLKPFFWIKWYT